MEYSVICCIGKAGNGMGGLRRAGPRRAGQGTVFRCRYNGSDIRLNPAESEEQFYIP
jgi:hypothetical protein